MKSCLSSHLIIKYFLLFIFGFVNAWSFPAIHAQDIERYRVMFYNVENLFDTTNDTLIRDEEFLPEGEKYWDDDKFYTKLNNIYRVIMSCGEWDPPALVGLCEIENRYVLEKLVYNTPLKKFDYKITHFDSPDRRGIDVALLYREGYFLPDTAYPISVNFAFDPDSKTRDILYVKGKIGEQETVHLFVNHWPSRYGGYLATVPKRNHTADVLRQAVDSILQFEENAAIVIMGDFNDGPLEESMLIHLGAVADPKMINDAELINLTGVYENMENTGTLKYKENWDVFDQIIVSGKLLDQKNGVYVSENTAMIHDPDFLYMEDEKYLGIRPFRTYLGYKYIGGYSDHLPVYLDLKIQ